MLSRGPGESYSDVILRIAREDEVSMKKFGIVFNHDEREYSVYPLHDELRALENIKLYQKKARVELTIWEAADRDAVMRAATAMNESRHYHEMPDTLSRYLPEEYFGEKI